MAKVKNHNLNKVFLVVFFQALFDSSFSHQIIKAIQYSLITMLKDIS